jgi:hypothetical protein
MNSKALLAASLLANAVLGYIAFRPAPPPTEAPPAPVSPTPTALVAKPAVKVVESTVTNTLMRTFNWESVESPDYREYIANLRSVGCPDETIRDIILADVNKLYDQKKKLVRGEPKKFEFWKATNPFAMAMGDTETMEKLRALDEEKRQVLRALGIEPDFKTEVAAMMNPMEAMLDFLPDAKKTQLLKLMSDMQGKMAKAMDGGRPDPEESARAQKEMEAAIKGMLTPQEALDFDLRMSMTANIMRSQVGGWDPNEQEFLEVFKLRKSFDDEFSPMMRGNESAEERQRREAAEKQLNENIRKSLGEAGWKDYEMAQKWEFQAAHRALKNTDQARQVYEMKQLVDEQAKALHRNRSLSPQERHAALEAIRSETESSLQRALGPDGWQRYNRGNNTAWLKGLVPSVPPPPNR